MPASGALRPCAVSCEDGGAWGRFRPIGCMPLVCGEGQGESSSLRVEFECDEEVECAKCQLRCTDAVEGQAIYVCVNGDFEAGHGYSVGCRVQGGNSVLCRACKTMDGVRSTVVVEREGGASTVEQLVGCVRRREGLADWCGLEAYVAEAKGGETMLGDALEPSSPLPALEPHQHLLVSTR